MNSDSSGIVYVLTNPAMPGLVKIGMTTRDKIDDRLRELFSTSVPVPFECDYACKVDDCNRVENALHIAFGPNRINPQREFFKIEPEQAIAFLSLLSKENVTPEVVKEYEAEIDEAVKESGRKLKIQRRPPLNFEEMGIEIGSKLQYAEGAIEVTVSNPRRVIYNGEEVSLTKLTQKLLELDYHVQPTKYWMYNGKNLQDIYDETYHVSND